MDNYLSVDPWVMSGEFVAVFSSGLPTKTLSIYFS